MAQIDETNVDTPQEGSNLSVEEAFFSADTEGTTEQNDSVSKDVSNPVSQEAIQNVSEDNEAKRFQYWQSQADKTINENEALKQQLNAMQSQVASVQRAQVPAEQQVEEFPSPQGKPEKPHGFNRAEALEDSSSPSARYLDEVESWRDDMTEYSTLKTEYSNAKVKERLDYEQAARVQNVKRAQAQQQANQQLRGIYDQVQGHHGLSTNEAKSFIQDMSKPDSLNIDNLVELWRIKQGSGGGVSTQPTQPSDTFNQQARAQQVARPMGVLPSQQPAKQSSEDSIMDSMIDGYKKSNPW